MHYMSEPVPISFRWHKDFVARIDAARGDVPRSTWVRRAIEERLQREGPIPTKAPGRRSNGPGHGPEEQPS